MRLRHGYGHWLPRMWVVACALAAGGCVGQVISNNESMAISNVRIVISGQLTYSAMCMGSYAPDFKTLGAKGYIPADLASSDLPAKRGYRYRMTAVKAPAGTLASECGEPYSDFELVAEPEQPGRTGVRYFRSRSDATIQEATKADFSDAKALQ